MFGYFGLLTSQTFPSPLGNVLSNGRPDYLCTDGLTGPFDTRVTQTMEGIEDLASGSKWDIRAGETVACVDYQVVTTNVNRLKV